jgi:hypothetical protein
VTRPAFRDVRFWLLALALAATLGALFAPPVAQTRNAYELLAYIDITASMNTRDMGSAEAPVSRLDAARDAVTYLVAALPCGSRLGLGVFAERRTFLLFEPIETCGGYAAIDGAVDSIDWRMGWAGDSHVSRGVIDAYAVARDIDADLLFLTDGHEAPPLPHNGAPGFEGEPGAIGGLIVGVGGRAKTPIPRFDSDGREQGVWRADEVPQENRSGPPPPDAKDRPGYHPRYAPWGAAAASGEEHLTEVKEDNLTRIAREAGLTYVALDAGPLLPAVIRAARARALTVEADIRWAPASLALALLVAAVFLVPLAERLRMPAPSPRRGEASIPPTASKVEQGAPYMRAAAILAICLLPFFATPSSAHGPTPQKAEETVRIAAPPEAVWAKVKDFGRIGEWHPGVASVAAPSDGERELTLKSGGVIGESRDDMDEAGMFVSWRLAKENVEAFPVSFYSSTLTVRPADGGSEVVWMGRFYRGDTSNFPPEHLNDAAAQKAMSGFMREGLDALKAALEKPEG